MAIQAKKTNDNFNGECSNAFAIAAKGLKGLHIIAQAEAQARGLGK